MPRLFVGIGIPDAIADTLLPLQSGLSGARWRPRDCFHITLRFIGEVDRPVMQDIDTALSQVSGYQFDARLKGVGSFGSKKPRAIWAGVDDGGSAAHLAAKVETALQRIGLEPERRKYTPHVTLAYLRGARPSMVDNYVRHHSEFKTDDFCVDRFILYESHLGKTTSHYAERADYTLDPSPFVET